MRIRVFADENGIGLLTMHAGSVSTVEPRARRIGELLADHAALALGRSDRSHDSGTMLVQRRIIGQAVSALMDHYRLDEQGAYEYLVRTCQHSSLQLPELAREVISQSGPPAPARSAQIRL